MKIQFYLDSRSETRWRAVADNHKIIAESGEGYTEQSDARDGFNLLREAMIEDYRREVDDESIEDSPLEIEYVGRDLRSMEQHGRGKHETFGDR